MSVGGYAQSRNNRRELRHRLIKQKLEEFYGPLLTIRSRVLAKSELRLKISQIAPEEWRKLVTGPEKSHPDRVAQT